MLSFNSKKSDYFLSLLLVFFFVNSFSQTVIPSGIIQLQQTNDPSSRFSVAKIENSFGSLRFFVGVPASGISEKSFKFVIPASSKTVKVDIGSANYFDVGLLNVQGGIVADGALVGEKNGKYAIFGHKSINSLDANNFDKYALLQENTGETFLNSGNTKNINFRINNSDRLILSNVSVIAKVPVYANDGIMVGAGLPAPNCNLTVRGRTYMLDNGAPAIPFKNINSEFYKNYLLWVQEGIVAEDVAIAKTEHWPDFVFDPNYKLNSIQELEKFIKANGHLPTMPSASDVMIHGFTVSDLTKRTVQTIEELTLHTIEQQKLIEKQSALIEALEKRVTVLEDRK